MSEWWTYQPADLLLFAPRVYYRLIALHNEAVWPLHILMAALGLAIIYRLIMPSVASMRVLAVILGAVWLWVGWSFVWERYATINWAVAYVAPLFAVQALLLLGLALDGRGPARLALGSVSGMAIIGLLIFAIAGYPLIAPLMGRDWTASEAFGIAPDPTAVATLAILALCQGRMGAAAMILPTLWCVITGVTLWTMESGDFFIAPLCALAAIGLAMISRIVPVRE